MIEIPAEVAGMLADDLAVSIQIHILWMAIDVSADRLVQVL